MIFEELFIRTIAGCTILASVTSAVGPAGYETIRKTIDMMGAVESAQENNAGGYGGRKVYSTNNDEKRFPAPQHLVVRGGPSFSYYVAAGGSSVVISTGPNNPTIYYTAPAGGISISRGSPGASYVVSTYPGVISSFPSSAGTAVSVQAYNNNVKVNADRSVEAVEPSYSYFSSSSTCSENLQKKENNHTSYPALNPVLSISTDHGGPHSSSVINLGGDGGPTDAAINGYYGYPALVAAQRNLQGASQLISRIASSLRL